MQNAISMENNSGFHGYSVSTIYPGWGQTPEHSTSTNPEPAEQAVTASVEQPDVNPVIDKARAVPIFYIIVALAVLVFLFGIRQG